MESQMTSLEQGVRVIADYVKTLPSNPGVYRMLNAAGDVLYVGKAKNLKKRVESYTHPDRLTNRLRRMISETAAMEFVTTHTEVEALLLEANLIKTLGPRYNILLKDGKFFSYITVTHHAYPRLTKHRGVRLPQDTYYGPYASADAVNESLLSLFKAFKLRSCSDSYFSARKRPCLQYHIKRCSAPCVGMIDEKSYKEAVDSVHEFLKGRSAEVQKRLAQGMIDASDNLDFEKAAVYRDQIRSLSVLQSQQTINSTHIEDADIFGIVHQGDHLCIQIFVFRGGSNHGSFSIFPSHVGDMSLGDILESFFLVFYTDKECPREILISEDFDGRELVAKALSVQAGYRVQISMPKRGPRVDFIEHARKNALEALERKLLHQQSQKEILMRLQSLLDLPKLPERIEVYDNSHIQGTDAIGAMIVTGREGFDKKSYRKFIIKDSQVFGDDFGMMREVIRRRFKGTLMDAKSQNPLPDLLLIDGGVGQVSAVLGVLDELNLSIPILGIAKGPDRHAGKETFHRPGFAPFTLEHELKVLYFLQRIRDEAHRFAIGFHRQKREKRSTESHMDSVPGVGAKRKKALLKHFGSAKAVMDAGVKDLALVEGISQSLALQIYAYFHKG